jgi:probable addiction module antidote protein
MAMQRLSRRPSATSARAKGMTEVARDAGLSRESLYKALSGDRTPSFETILKVVVALGIKLHAEEAPVAK